MLRSQKMTLPRVLPILLLLVVFFCGCGAGTHSLKGTATYDGQPIASGTVSLVPVETVRPAAGATATIVDGKFAIPAKFGVVSGQYRVCVDAVDLDKKIPASFDGVDSYAPLFPTYSIDHTFLDKGPLTLDITVPKQ